MGRYCAVTRDGSLTIVTLTIPEKLNSLNAAACFELEEVWNEFDRDPDQWVAIITGEGRAFCAGHDLADAPEAPMPKSGWAGLSQRRGRRKPIIAAVNGPAFGGGFEIALTCDIVVADEKAEFALSEPRVGLVALGGGIQRLALSIPTQAAMGLMLTGRRIHATEAQHLGIVNEIAPAGTVMETARKWADEILACSPLAVRYTKELALEAIEGLSLPDHVAMREQEIATKLFQLEDTREGIAAFLGKRQPRWVGA
ncbi:MAG: caiD [Bradyrhizobium sp.]|nr:caiD [Bradyrhizobium sp.]